MRILWVCNGKPSGLYCTVSQMDTGGWISGLLCALRERENIELDIVYPCHDTTETEEFGQVRAKGIRSHKRLTRYDTPFEQAFRTFIKGKQYDCVHIWGTEFPHTLAAVHVCREEGMGEKVLIGIQGLCGFISLHYMAGITKSPLTFRDVVKRDSLPAQKRKFACRGKFEAEAIGKCTHITGRTDWDKICTALLNPNRQYHYCHEVMREVFYQTQWTPDTCEPYRVFTSQAYYPIKGLHYLLQAILILRRQGKPVELYIAGGDITSASPIRITGYGLYLKRMIRKNDMQEYVHFTGPLTAEQMAEQYRKAQVFVLPSAIENSPNSLAEAMLIGTPCVAADVGGVKDMIQHGEEGFVYQHDAFYMLAGYMNRLFDDRAMALRFSQKARSRALKDHDPQTNAQRMVNIYRHIGFGEEIVDA